MLANCYNLMVTANGLSPGSKVGFFSGFYKHFCHLDFGISPFRPVNATVR